MLAAGIKAQYSHGIRSLLRMIKQLLLLVTGDFNHIEYKNLVADRTETFNFQYKSPSTPNIRFKTKIEAEDRIGILLEGDAEEVRALGDTIKRGPLTAHIMTVDELWRDARPAAGKPEGQANIPGRKKRRRRRRPQ